MRRALIALLVHAVIAVPAFAQQEIDNVAAFARLYGAVRWFYPGDASAELDWNRFAVHGVSQVRAARNPRELERALEALFTPLGPGIEIGATLPPKRPTGGRDTSLVAWHYYGAGITENIQGPYRAKRSNRTAATATRPSNGTMTQMLGAEAMHGRTIRLRGRARVPNPAAEGWAGFWLRVDRPQNQVGFFDNMQDRPVRDTAWREYAIEGRVASDATRIVFGALMVGATGIDVDGIELAMRADDGSWTPLTVRDASFEVPADSAFAWAQNGQYAFTRPASGAAHGTRFVRITPSIGAMDTLETPIGGAAIDVDLGRGLKARVPLSLSDADARVRTPGLAVLRDAIAMIAGPSGRYEADVRLADAVVAWNAFRHFYPYWNDIPVDWDARLKPQLETALAAETRDAHRDALRALVADLQDGHGGVRDVANPPAVRWLPLQFRILGAQLVVTASRDTAVPVGSVIVAIDGEAAATRSDRETRLASGTLQWRQSRAVQAMQLCRKTNVLLKLELPTGTTKEARVDCSQSMTARAVEARPDSIAELQPGIWYVDLTRVRTAELRPALEKLSKANGVVFDMRGYPTDAGAAILPHLMSAAEESGDRWMHVSRIAAPFGGIVGWQSFSWHLLPATPHIGGQRVFITDGRAISYAESVMGYVRDYKLGTIIGGPTAGANGNVAGFSVPGGFSIVFTGMRVTRHDGRTAFHTAGVSPDVPLEPTLLGIRAKRDELLERALSTLRVQP